MTVSTADSFPHLQMKGLSKNGRFTGKQPFLQAMGGESLESKS